MSLESKRGGTAQLYAIDANFGEAIIRISRGNHEKFLYVEPLTGFVPEEVDPVWAEMTIAGDQLSYVEPLAKRRPLLEVVKQVRITYEGTGTRVRHYLVTPENGSLNWTQIQPSPPII